MRAACAPYIRFPPTGLTWLEARFRVVADDPWGHSWKAYESKRYTFVLEAIRKWLQGESLELLAGSCLDIGCSTGHFSKKLRDLFQRVVAVDISHTAVERAKLNYPGIDFHCGTLPPLRHVCHRGIIGIDSRRYIWWRGQRMRLFIRQGTAICLFLFGIIPGRKQHDASNITRLGEAETNSIR